MGGPTKTRLQRASAVALALGFVLSNLLQSPAFAGGTMTGSTLTVSNPAYAIPGGVNTKYDFAFTAATSSTLAGFNASVPTDTDAVAPRYLATSGESGNWAWAPDSVATSLADVVDLKVQATLANWATACQQLVGKKDASQASYSLRTGCAGSEGYAQVSWTADGTTERRARSTVPIPFANNQMGWLRATLVASTGTVNFYTSTDGTSWTPLGAAATTTPGTIYDGTDVVGIAGYSYYSGAVQGRFWFASVGSTISGTTSSASLCSSTGVVACFNPYDYSSGAMWVSSSPQAEVWTLERGSGSAQPSDIVSDLILSSVVNLPADASVTLRRYGGGAGRSINVLFTSPFAMTPATLRQLSVSGFVNTATAQSFTSTIRTADTSAPPVIVDTGTTTALVFAYPTVNATASAVVDPILSFVVATTASCDISTSAGVTTSASSVDFGHLLAGTAATGAQTLQVTTNAANGFVVTARSPAALTGPAGSIAAVSAVNAAPAAFPPASTAAFGYHVNNVSRFASAWAGFEPTSQPIVENTTNACIAYRVQAAADTPAGSYSATVIYTATPTF